LIDYNRQLSVLFICHGVGETTFACFCYTVALTYVTKQKYWCFDSALCKKTPPICNIAQSRDSDFADFNIGKLTDVASSYQKLSPKNCFQKQTAKSKFIKIGFVGSNFLKELAAKVN
jgi:hypothetical protein